MDALGLCGRPRHFNGLDLCSRVNDGFPGFTSEKLKVLIAPISYKEPSDKLEAKH